VDALPEIDEHVVEVDASRDRVWSTLENGLPSLLGGSLSGPVTRVLGCRDRSLTARAPIVVGATVPGFHVSETRRPSLLVLEGEHRFSRYRLTVHIDEVRPARSRVRAQTHAAFPRLHGTVYRALVIGTRGHVLAVRRILAAIKRRSETP
jgi:hypothetical protein